MPTKFNYENAVKEIESIIKQIEEETVEVDQLSELVKKATVLIGQCQQKLKSIDEGIESAIRDFEEQ